MFLNIFVGFDKLLLIRIMLSFECKNVLLLASLNANLPFKIEGEIIGCHKDLFAERILNEKKNESLFEIVTSLLHYG